jgi:cytochrome c
MGFRHGSIEAGIEAVKKLGLENNIAVEASEDAALFTEENLNQYAAIVFLNTTGDILNAAQQADFERYIQSGGGFVGIHAATDTEYHWPWYNGLVGAYFDGHPAVQEANMKILDKKHPSTEGLDDVWSKSDEWYNFKQINPNIKVLIEIDESSYEGGKHGNKQHPIAWYHEYDGGRSFYTEMGHTDETFENPTFLSHLLGGIQYAIGNNVLDYEKAQSIRVPEENRFVRKVLDFNLDEPMELDELPNRGILFVERRGALKLYDFETEQTKILAQLDLFYGNEDGLLGIAVDPNYVDNNWIYLFYTASGEESKQHVSRFDLVGDSLDFSSEKILLTIPTIRACCHSGGALEFGPNGNLFIGLGDNTNPFESNGYAPIDERKGRALWDAQKSAANTNDLRGKILRIKPEVDGTYSIPEGNLFPEGTPNTRPEIYVMGCRNPFRPSIDSQTGYVYWGDVGPDAGKGDPNRGPKGMGEFNQARKAGFWGWPYTRGNNQVYNDFDFISNQSGAKFDPNNIINNSPNNTGLQKLPPIQPSMIWYSYDLAEEFPWLGKGGVNPMAGPVFHAADFESTNFPTYFENKLFVYEWVRDWIYVVTLDDNQDFVEAAPFMPNSEFSHPMDMIFASDGNLYLLEYGQKWNSRNLDARLNKITFQDGNRKPIAKIAADAEIGAAPLTVQFSSSESIDYDGDELHYEWRFTSKNVDSKEANPTFTFDEVGIYDVQLTITDKEGLKSTATKKIMVGNDAPQVKISIDNGENIYWDHKKIAYKIEVSDAEDGTTSNNSIAAEDVKVTLDYIPEGEDIILATIGHQQNTVPEGKILIDNSDCKACHAIDVKVNGPSYIEVAKKYTKADRNTIVSRIIKGSSGIWGEHMMSAHPQLKIPEVQKIVDYILSLKPKKEDKTKNLALEGILEFKEHLGKAAGGKYILMASYRDKGNPALDESILAASAQHIFKAPKIEAETAEERSEGLGNWNTQGATVVGSIAHDTYLKYEKVNFKGLKSINLAAKYNANYPYKGVVQVRAGAKDGKILGSAAVGYFHKKKAGKKQYDIELQPYAENADLYLTFHNPADKEQFAMNADWFILNYQE